MDEEIGLSEDEVTEVWGHLQAMMDAISGVRTQRNNPEQRRIYWSKYFQHQAEINRLTPPTDAVLKLPEGACLLP